MTRVERYRALYKGRLLSEAYPDLDGIEAHQVLGRRHRTATDCWPTVTYVTRLLRSSPDFRKALVVGCGAQPEIVRSLIEAGFDAVGVEPVLALAREAREFLGCEAAIAEGCAEALPVGDASQAVVLLESVLEHVDSPERTVAELFRVLKPGGLAYITTTNRLALRNHEYRRRFFQWYPALLKEAYVHHHLHFDPSLANYTTRPAVHWFSYADLCRLGRGAGFFRFYSKLDVVTTKDPPIAASRLRRLLLPWIQTSPLLRALALTQDAGGTVFMLKRWS